MVLKFFSSFLLLFLFNLNYAQDYFDHHNTGVDYYKSGDFSNALTEFERAITLLSLPKWKKYKSEFVYLEASSSAACLGDNIKAFSYLREAINLGFNNYDKLLDYTCIEQLTSHDSWKILKDEMLVKRLKYFDVKNELEEVKRRDQVLRRLLGDANKVYKDDTLMIQTFKNSIRILDSINVNQIVHIIENYGWLTKSKIGTKASDAFWLVLVHGDKKLIDEFLPLVKKKAEIGEILGDQYAIYYDKYLIKNNQKQKYGTQLSLNSSLNTYYIKPIQDPTNVDELRAQIGMETIGEYIIFCKELFGKDVVFEK